MSDEIKLLDVVALLEDAPSEGLRRGEVGTVVEVFAEKPGLVGHCLSSSATVTASLTLSHP